MGHILVVIMMVVISSFARVEANMITNGDFANCQFLGWQTDTDGNVGSDADFSMVNQNGNCAAQIRADYDDTDVFFANTLYQSLHFTSAPDTGFLLRMELDALSASTQSDAGFIADMFFVAINDGQGHLMDGSGNAGFLLAPTEINGARSYDIAFWLSPLFAVSSNWYLDIQLLIGTDVNGLSDFSGSTLRIDNVSLTPFRQISAPSCMGILLLSGLVFARFLLSKRSD
ncbi:hypothetical protein OE749_07565 [Aestuariibacter sp. AA17]|uniref:PEP-CTERM sorting domain-containing protein n=1 Tax=Fluctibacter corallii TaxID=2984329 RepID=A0ABT3A7H0_9ALTE|nr:hypothetical protein [Aestuariibacter sp. AA17]MCV2884548.1 hypothetical protein [Aestuariibacter sp. AA17]